MGMELMDLSNGTRTAQNRYVAPNGVIVTSSMTQYSNGNYYYLTYLFNNSMRTGARNYYMASGGNNGYIAINLSMVARPVTIIRIYPYTRDDTSSNYRISISRDNVNWVEAVPLVNNHHAVNNANYIAPGVYREHKFPFPPNYIRIYLTYRGSWGVSLNEIQLFHQAFKGKFLMQDGEKLYKFTDTKEAIASDVNLVPIMKSNDNGASRASASSQWSEVYQPFKAFNGTIADNTDGWHAVSGATYPQWLAFQFNAPVVVKKFRITARLGLANQSPRNFILQGRLNGEILWKNIKTFTQGTTTWSAGTARDFDCIENNTSYIEYRLYIQSNVGGSRSLSIGKWEMFGEEILAEKRKIEEYLISELSPALLESHGEDVLNISDYDRRLRTLDFMEFNVREEKVAEGATLKEDKLRIDLDKLFDIRRLK